LSEIAVDRYKICSPLRCDGVGSLDCAEDEAGMRMAIRWLPLEANGDAAVKTVEKLPAHPMLPKIRGIGQVGTAAFVAMEFPEGKLLSTVLGQPMEAAAVRRLGAEMLDALAAVHAEGSFHGELSADSILLLPDGRAVLWDMPLVIANRLTDRRGEERFMRQLMHMAPFLSPERARGYPATAASDLFSLGAVLCIAAGTLLPDEGSALTILHRIATGQWTLEVPASLPADLRSLLARMLSPQPSARPSAKDAARLLSGPMAARRSAHGAVTEPEMPAVSVPASAVVAPSIEVATDQIAARDVLHFALDEPTDPAASSDDLTEELPAIGHRPPRMIWAVVAGLAALLLSGGAMVLWHLPRHAVEMPVPQGRAAPEAREPRMTLEQPPLSFKRAADIEDEAALLQPLVRPGKHTHPPKRTPAPAAKTSPTPSLDNRDYTFLPSDAQAPRAALKRP
jgi:serine/threonine protein kinase